MQKRISIIAAFLLASVSAWTAPKSQQVLAQKKCTIKQIDRSRVHKNVQGKGVQTPESPSPNWSGYVAGTNLETAADGTVNAVSGTWTVPTILPPVGSGYTSCAIWVGIDGYMGSTVEQMGTLHEWIGGGLNTWVFFETYPGPCWEITGFPANAGDQINCSVTYLGNNVFSMVVTNLTQNTSLTIPTAYTTAPNAARSCAEWIVEAPAGISINGGPSAEPLADFGTVNFTNCSATINNITGSINNGNWQNYELVMFDNSKVLAQPSLLSPDGTSFQVTWEATQ